METARAARAEVREGSIGHQASGERRSRLDRHRADGREIRGAVETHSGGLIVDRADAPCHHAAKEEFATKDSELLACDVECRLAGIEGFYLELDIPGLDELIGGAR